jgi:hypothetical protein
VEALVDPVTAASELFGSLLAAILGGVALAVGVLLWRWLWPAVLVPPERRVTPRKTARPARRSARKTRRPQKVCYSCHRRFPYARLDCPTCEVQLFDLALTDTALRSDC